LLGFKKKKKKKKNLEKWKMIRCGERLHAFEKMK